MSVKSICQVCSWPVQRPFQPQLLMAPQSWLYGTLFVWSLSYWPMEELSLWPRCLLILQASSVTDKGWGLGVCLTVCTVVRVVQRHFLEKHLQDTVQVAKDQTHWVLRGTRAGPSVWLQFSEFRIREIVIPRGGVDKCWRKVLRLCRFWWEKVSMTLPFGWLGWFVQDSRLMVPTALQSWAYRVRAQETLYVVLYAGTDLQHTRHSGCV